MEQIRRALKRSLSRRLVESIQFFKNYPAHRKSEIHKFLSEDAITYLAAYAPFEIGEIELFGKQVKFSHGASLIHMVEEIFVDRIYDFKTERSSPYIIDCGSNIGLSIIFLKELYPSAKILAFEPDDKIFSLLRENIERFGYSNVELLKLAAWNKDEQLQFFSEGALAGSLSTDYWKKDNKILISAIDLAKYLNEPIDFLKIDIEGAEHTVLRHIAKNLSLVQNLFIEYHSCTNDPQELGELLLIVKEAGFRYYIKEAASLAPIPMIREHREPYDLQLNIFCVRI